MGLVVARQNKQSRLFVFCTDDFSCPEQVSSIVTWLRALTGELPLEYARKPELFPNGPATPKPAKD
jgi:hypothetical protein